jgi:hypothetical protein
MFFCRFLNISLCAADGWIFLLFHIFYYDMQTVYRIKNIENEIQKGCKLFCTDKMTEGNIQYNKINNIYLIEIMLPLEMHRLLGFVSVDNDFSG